MTNMTSLRAPALEVASEVPTDEGRLRVTARQVGRRWVVRAACGDWDSAAVGPDLGTAVQTALGRYADGVALQRNASDER
jgi:hypothetical protein